MKTQKRAKVIRAAVRFFIAGTAALVCTVSLLLPPATATAGLAVARLLAANTYSIRFYDTSGSVIGANSTAEGEWRMLIPGKIPEKVELAFTAVEDWRFRQHCGIDFTAVLRAAFQNFTTGTIVSGASTVSMQLARCLDYRGRSWKSKIRESLRALALERHFSKDTLLRLYLDNLPFGGRIYGLETAAQYYFSTTTVDLTDEELVLLAGIPQRPNAFRPDKYPEAAAKRRAEVLYLLEYHKVISAGKSAELAQRPVYLKTGDYSGRAAAELLQSQHYCQLAVRENTSPYIITFIDRERQADTVKMARAWTANFANVNDCAVIAVNNHDLTVRILTGGLEYHSPAAGMVNSAAARRSPGSLLKPFIYGCAIKKGLIVPETVIRDDKINFHGYVPENFSREFTGRTTATRALADSLNIPAVVLLAKVGLADWFAELNAFGITLRQNTANGLSAALGGGVEISPLEAAEAYAAIANGGLHGKLRFTTAAPYGQSQRIWSESTAYLVNSMLRRPLPGAPELDAAWKTGTSQGRRDAWCAAWDRDFTVVVWMGNKQGKAAAGLVGVEAAAPLAGRILTMLHTSVPATPWQGAAESDVEMLPLCAETGMRAWTGCKTIQNALAAGDIPLQPCRECSSLAGEKTAEKLLKPVSGTFYTGKNNTAKIDFQAVADKISGVLWYSNGVFLGRESEFTGEFPPGNYTVTAVFPASSSTRTVKIQVLPLQ